MSQISISLPTVLCRIVQLSRPSHLPKAKGTPEALQATTLGFSLCKKAFPEQLSFGPPSSPPAGCSDLSSEAGPTPSFPSPSPVLSGLQWLRS